MNRITVAGLALGAIGIICLLIGPGQSVLAANNQHTTASSSSPATQPAAQPTWASTWGPPSNYGPGSIAPNGAPDSIGNGAASCPTAGSNSNQRSGNQQSFNQQSGNQQGGNANQSGQSGGGRHRHHRGSGQGQGGQQPAPTATPVPSQPIGS